MSPPSLPWTRRVKTWLVVYGVTGLVAGCVSDLAGSSQNLSVFRAAALALWKRAPMYERFSWDFDFYKYGPSFALAFSPFAWLPWHVAAAAWSWLNFVVAAYGIARLTRTAWSHLEQDARERRASFVLALAWPGIVLTTDGDQSNLLVAGISMLAGSLFLERKPVQAAPWLSFVILIKLFPAAFAMLALVERGWRRALVWLAVFLAVFAALPASVVGPARLVQYYLEWRGMLVGDHRAVQASWSHWSIMHALDALLGPAAERDNVVQVVSLLVFLGSAVGFALRARRLEEPDRRRLAYAFVAATWAFVLLFNHRSESPTYVLSAIASAMYLAMLPRRRPWHWAFFVLLLLAPSPLHSDYRVPGVIGFLSAKRLFHPLRMLPLAVLWGILTAQLVGVRRSSVSDSL